ncbi:MAG: glutamate-1-semialdehyde 2,1-aminomutase [Fuerstiella sp.]|nr:glutamate-1-semialdehyde 2,1-aminomutase [Fuerstiella sp.]MCP4786412.1 glutamate-1-semialdehyde 2,1-aminomutase [Fuerstiella sp.]
MTDTSSRPNSQEQFERACRSIPGGVNSPARAFGAVGGVPPFIQRGDGPFLFDIDGNQFIDFVGSWGPHILGHRHPAVIEAIQKSLDTGTSFGAPTVAESELAELVVELVPSVEKVRMVSSGTEATMSAIRLARGFTGRSVVVKFAGCYHGHVDSLLVQAGSGALTLGTPSSPGVPAGCTADTLVLPYNDVAMLQQAFEQKGDSLAAVILEPVCGNMGCVIPSVEFLRALRQLCTDHGAVLIFDEVMTGFRVDLGSAQTRLGVTPDLTTLGKIIGGGMPVGAYGGRAEIMDAVSPVGGVYQAGTLSGNPLAMASGLATLEQLRQANPYDHLEQLAAQLQQGFLKAAGDAGVPVQVNRVGSMLTLFFNEHPVTDLQTATASDTERFARWFHAMLDRGIYLPCSQFEALFVSAAHTPELIDQTIVAASAVMPLLSDPA